MQSSCIIKTDDIFNELSKITTETKRWLVGKYFTGTEFKTDLTKAIPIYNGVKICHRKFGFTLNGSRCFWCNTFCLLTKEGEIISGEPISIESGSFKKQKIVIIKDELPTIPFGTYEKHIVNFVSHVLNIEKMIRMERMINKSCDASHSIAISSLINSSIVPFKSRILGGWLCDTVNTVKILSNPGNLIGLNFDKIMVKDMFFQIFVLSGNDYFNHGSPATKHLSLGSMNNVFDVGNGRKINLTYTMFIDPDIYSSFYTEYNGRKIHFVGRHSSTELTEPNWNLEYIIGTKSKNSKITSSPLMKKYAENRIAVFKPTVENINYIRLSGINVFPQLNLFLYLTILLTNRSFYDIFTNCQMNDIIKKCFIGDEYERYLSLVRENFGCDLDADQIARIVIDSGMKIRYDLYSIIGSEILNLYN